MTIKNLKLLMWSLYWNNGNTYGMGGLKRKLQINISITPEISFLF